MRRVIDAQVGRRGCRCLPAECTDRRRRIRQAEVLVHTVDGDALCLTLSSLNQIRITNRAAVAAATTSHYQRQDRGNGPSNGFLWILFHGCLLIFDSKRMRPDSFLPRRLMALVFLGKAAPRPSIRELFDRGLFISLGARSVWSHSCPTALRVGCTFSHRIDKARYLHESARPLPERC